MEKIVDKISYQIFLIDLKSYAHCAEMILNELQNPKTKATQEGAWGRRLNMFCIIS